MAEAPTPPNNQVFIAPEQMQGFIDSINSLNTAINRLNGDPGTGYRSSFDDHLGEEEPGTDVVRKTVEQRYDAQKDFKRMVAKSVDERTADLERMFNARMIQVGREALTPAQMSERLENPNDSLYQQINKVIVDKMKVTADRQETKFTRIMDAVQEAGLKQLRFGQLPPQQILQGAGQLMQRYAAHRVSIGRGGRIAGGLGALGEGLSAVGDVLGPATVIAQEARRVYDSSMGNYRALTASGQLTGQGTIAGFEAKYVDPLRIFNPFGRLNFGQAQEIVQSTREQGFTGPQAGRVEQGLATVVSNLGIQIGQATQFMTQSMREGGMSVAEVTQEMNTFHDATRNLNMNINDYTQMIMDSTSSLRQMGAGQAAPGLAQQLTAALPRAYRTPQGMQFLTGAFEKSRGVLAGMVGGGANVLNITSQRYARAGWSAMDTLLQREVQRARDQGYTTPNDIANYLSQTSPFFGGTDVNQLQQYIEQVHHGRGITSQLTMSHLSTVYARRFGALERQPVRLRNMTPDELRQHNLRALYRSSTGGYSTTAARGQKPIAFENEITGRRYGADTFRDVDTGHYNINKASRYKHELVLSAERNHLLTQRQLEELKQANPRDVTSVLTNIMQQRGRKVDVSTQIGTVTVELGKEASGLLTLVKERNSALSRGHVNSNQTGG
jgi:hypothetical protein